MTPLLILIFACGGGGGGTTADLGSAAGTIGQICNTGEGSYSIELSSGSATATVTPDPIEGAYQGNIGGQIRGITSIAVTTGENGETSDMLAWGSGSSIKFGSVDAVLGSATMKHPGAVTDLATSSLSGKQVIVYGTERGVGIAGPDADGQLTDYAASGAWRSVPSGVRSLTVGLDGRTVLFASNDGYLQQITVDALSSGERCAGVLSRFVEGAEGQEAMAPVKMVETSSQSFILSKTQSALTSVAPTFELVFNPFFKSMIDATPYAAVSTLSGTAVGFATRDDSFNRFDRFIPTDIASDGTNLYVVGLAFTQDSVAGLLGGCGSETDQVKCMGTLAKDSKIELYKNNGIYQFVGGFFVYRNLGDLTKADHFSTLPISNYNVHDDAAPPLIYAIAVAGDQGYIRGTNFLTSMSRQTDVSGDEEWRFDATAKIASGLMQGIPTRVIPYGGGAAASFTGVRAADGSGASALELMGTDGAFDVVDTGAIAVRIEGVGQTSKLVAAIEMVNDRGGNLFLENAGARKPITISNANSFASRAAYNDVRLAFAWSVGGSLEASSQWRIAVQEGSNNDTRGEFGVNRTTNTGGEFDGFPSVTSSDATPGKLRGVADMEFAPDGNLAVLFSGYKSGKWYQQVGIYSAAKSSGKYLVQHVAASKALESTGGETDHGGAILRVTGSGGSYQVIFSTAAGIFKWTGTDKGAAASVVPIANAVDVTMDAAGGNLAAWITGFTLSVKDITKSGAAATIDIAKLSGSTATRLSSARVALSGNALAVATPYSAANTFSFFNLQSGAPTLVAGTTYSRFFDVKLYSSFPDYLLANSQAGGIEMYLISE